jgi:L-alanine-DL-glutamate epimerase-like enolase superfamily enzyme
MTTTPHDPALDRFAAIPVTDVRARITHYDLRTPFRISRGTSVTTDGVLVEVVDDAGRVGRGECTPYRRYGEDAPSTRRIVERAGGQLIGSSATPAMLHDLLSASAARNALDAALWDLACKRSGRRAWQLLGIEEPPAPCQSVDTLVLDEPDAVRAAASQRAERPVLKIKLDAERIVERVRAAREGAPGARLVVDANESWTRTLLDRVVDALAEAGVEMIEQPVRAGDDAALDGYDGPIPLCADESCHTRMDLPRLEGRYTLVNVKLDKTGGLTEALALAEAARAAGFGLMLGCMVSSSLAIAPAIVFAAAAEPRFVDLDGPTWLKNDPHAGLVDEHLLAHPPAADVWG